MSFISFMLKGNYRRFYEELKKISQQNGKSALLMFLDAGISSLLTGSGLQDYLNYRFYEKPYQVRRTYVTIGYMNRALNTLDPMKYAPYTSNKLNFHKHYPQFTRREYVAAEDGFEAFKAFIGRHAAFVYKPQVGLAGHKVEKIVSADIPDLKLFYKKFCDEKAIAEELVVQDAAWEVLSPGSVNTLRVITGTSGGKARILFAAARIGSGASIVDNFHKGGFGVLVDMESGKLVGKGIDKALNERDSSPTGIPLDGFTVPYWTEICDMVCRAAEVNPNVHFVGWDVAIAKDGPLLIEGNRGSGFDLVQMLLGHGAKYMIDDLLTAVKKEK